MSRFRYQLAAQRLHQGTVIAYPTEAVYGLGCDPLNPQAVQRILQMKRRPMHKGLILIASKVSQLNLYVDLDDPCCAPAIDAWPAPQTWILPKRAGVPNWISGEHNSIACRVTEHPVASALCEAFGGALISTSANRASFEPARNPLRVKQQCPTVDMIVHGELGKLDQPTQIFDARSGRQLR